MDFQALDYKELDDIIERLKNLRDGQILTGFPDKERKEILTVLKVISDLFGVTLKQMLGRSKARYIFDVKVMFSCTLNGQLGYPLARIASILNCHHTSIMYHVREYPNLMIDENFKSKALEFREAYAKVNAQNQEA